jgi:chemotaxis protein histidine kinase CheA
VNANPDLQRKLSGVRLRYLQSLEGQADILRLAVIHLDDPMTRAAAVRDIAAIAHRIRGTARTLRLTAIGDAAERVERLASDRGDRVDLVPLSRACDDFIAKLRRGE